MKFFATTTLLSVALLAGCAEMSDTTTAADQFIGKQLVAEDGTTFIFMPAGAVAGTIRGEDVVGTYEATASEICSTYSSPEFLTGQEFCSTPEVTGDTVVFNRRDGSQSAVYAIEG
ncbi:MAG: hypothetical protein AAGH70_01095 [Pseudomonadota bacterium]